MIAEATKIQSQLVNLAASRFEKSSRVPELFFAEEAEKISEACLAMAQRFYRGGRILAFGNGAAATDAHHVSVEFVHPVIVGKKALPALALTNDSASLTAASHPGEAQKDFQRQLESLAKPEDMALGFSRDGNCKNVLQAIYKARGMHLLTIGFTGEEGGDLAQAELDFCFVVRDADPFVVQEVHETLYHVLWELVHVFFEHEGLLK